MPELAECEANRRRVEAQCLNRTIQSIETGETSHMDLPDEAERARLVGRQFTAARRHGKAIFAGSQAGPWIAASLGMTGSLRVYNADETPPDHARMTFVFEGDRRLAFCCPRKLGGLGVIDDPDRFISDKGLGPDAMDISAAVFSDVIGRTRGAVKSALMAQKKIAGIGNLWSDEALFQAGIAPGTRADTLSDARLAKLFASMREVLGLLLEADAAYHRIPDDWLFPHREAGTRCPRCDGSITRSKVGGRSAYHCTGHQSGARG